MFKAVKKYQKSIMAIFAVGLMITFVASFGVTPDGGASNYNPVVGNIYGDEKVHLQDLNNARRLWEKLKGTPLVFGDQMVPAIFRLAPMNYIRMRGESLPQIGIDKDPDAFFALLKEADRLGITPPEDDVQEIIANSVHPRLRPDPDRDPGAYEELRQAIIALLKVEYAYQRATSVIKVSAPERQSDAARFGQELTVNFVEYNAEDFKKAVPAPTPEQLLKQFEAFANSPPDQVVDDTNPFGFGYRYPNRVKVEFITLLREQLREAVRKSKDDVSWELEARKHYLRNPAKYPTSQPAEPEKPSPLMPTTAPTTAPTTQPLGFDHYKKQILDEMIDAEAAKLGEQIRKRIVATMEQDYNAWRAAVGADATTRPATRPADGPASSVGVPYGSDQYLSALAHQIQSEFKIFPVVMTLNKDWQSQKDLTGITAGTPRLKFRHPQYPDLTMPGMTWAEYLTTHVDVFGHTPSPTDQGPTLSIMQPSVPLTDEMQNVYVFRVTAADPAHPAAEMEPYAEQVEKDYRTAEAVNLARAEADKLLGAARKEGLEAAAKAAGKTVKLSGAISQFGVEDNDALKLKFESQRLLRKAAYDLLTDADAVKAGRAVGVVNLPRDGKVLVISVADIKPTQPDRPAYQLELMYARARAMEAEDAFLEAWFDGKNVIKRTRLELDNRKSEEDDTE